MRREAIPSIGSPSSLPLGSTVCLYARASPEGRRETTLGEIKFYFFTALPGFIIAPCRTLVQ
jgi:hypothetical protein